MLPNIYILGYGNLGQHLLKLFLSKEISIQGVFTNQNVDLPVQVIRKTEINTILEPQDLVFITTKDDELVSAVESILVQDVLKVICSGGVAITSFKDNNVGVWYPLYSFSKDIEVDWIRVPVFVEYLNHNMEMAISKLNETLNVKNRFLNSDQRGKLHLAAVFANNFVNACLIASSEVLKEQHFDVGFHDLLPIIEQTVEKVKVKNAMENQTGPAKRGDLITMRRHLESLENLPYEKLLYENISSYIQQKSKNNL